MSCQDSRVANNTKAFTVFMLTVGAIVVIILTSQRQKETQSLAQIVERVTTTSVETSTTTQEITTESETQGTSTTVLEPQSQQSTPVECPEKEVSPAVIECPKCHCKRCKVCDSTYVRRRRDRFAHNVCSHDIKRLLDDDVIAIEYFTDYLRKTKMYDDFCQETNSRSWQKFLLAKSKQRQAEKIQRIKEKEEAAKACDYSIHNCGPTCLNYDFGMNKC